MMQLNHPYEPYSLVLWRQSRETSDGMQVLFSTVFAFSVNLLQLVIFEVLGALDYRCEMADMSQNQVVLFLSMISDKSMRHVLLSMGGSVCVGRDG